MRLSLLTRPRDLNCQIVLQKNRSSKKVVANHHQNSKYGYVSLSPFRYELESIAIRMQRKNVGSC